MITFVASNPKNNGPEKSQIQIINTHPFIITTFQKKKFIITKICILKSWKEFWRFK